MPTTRLAEDERHDDRLDHPEEDRRQRLERRADVHRGPDRVVEVPDHHTQDRRDDDPLGEGRPAKEGPHRGLSPVEGSYPASAPALASMPLSSERKEAANLSTPSVSSSCVTVSRSMPAAARAPRRSAAVAVALGDPHRRRAVVAVRREGLGRKGVDGLGRDQRLDVVHVGQGGVLGAGRGPERALHPRAAPGERRPARAAEHPLERGVGQAGVGDGDGAPEVGAPRALEHRVHLGVHPAHEEAGDRGHVVERLSRRGAPFEPAQVRLHDRLVPRHREEQRHVDVDPVGDAARDGAEPLHRARDLDHHVGPRHRRPEPAGRRLGGRRRRAPAWETPRATPARPPRRSARTPRGRRRTPPARPRWPAPRRSPPRRAPRPRAAGCRRRSPRCRRWPSRRSSGWRSCPSRPSSEISARSSPVAISSRVMKSYQGLCPRAPSRTRGLSLAMGSLTCERERTRRTVSATCAAVKPNSSNSRSPGAEAPKWSRLTASPPSPSQRCQPKEVPASTLTRARRAGGSTSSRYASGWAANSSHEGRLTTRARTPSCPRRAAASSATDTSEPVAITMAWAPPGGS